MALYRNSEKAVLRRALVSTLAFALMATAGCNSNKTSTDTEHAEEEKTAAEQKTAPPQDDTGIDLNCVMDHIQNPSEAFHYSYKKESSSPVEEEADITPQTIDGSFTNSSGSHPIHGVHSDADNWHMAWAGLSGISGMSATIALVRNGSASVREGAEKMNGYDAIRYSIDTSRGEAVEQSLYRNVLGDGGFEKGTVWVTAQGCPVKMVLDSEQHTNDGSVDKVHYEEAMIRK